MAFLISHVFQVIMQSFSGHGVWMTKAKFSGNIRYGYRNLNSSSAPKAATANPSLTVEKKFKRSDIENMEKNLSIYKY